MTASLTIQPGYTRALAAVRSAEIGLLRAVALDVVSIGAGNALRELGTEAIDVLRAATGPTTVDLQAHSTADGGATTFLGRAGRGVVVSAHLSIVEGERREHLRAAIRLVGTHGSVLVDLLRPRLDVRTAAGTRQVPFGVPRADAPLGDAADTLAAIAESARSGRTTSITW
ncbi:Gfo/Idh/MocA family oxidoreductase [Agrococcus baldri]|uniref:Uncharacterized protein n=1 Tax=Agrococcus baldri TaxID=153730 RepID=A0AA87RGF1_9MICO|nr:hypothetical protein [Agrococcus baldri]GEK80169.1 hypothetical protein ABA31_15200 [Agrococcus baldri]